MAAFFMFLAFLVTIIVASRMSVVKNSLAAAETVVNETSQLVTDSAPVIRHTIHYGLVAAERYASKELDDFIQNEFGDWNKSDDVINRVNQHLGIK